MVVEEVDEVPPVAAARPEGEVLPGEVVPLAVEASREAAAVVVEGSAEAADGFRQLLNCLMAFGTGVLRESYS